MAICYAKTVVLLGLAFCCVAAQRGLHLKSYSEDGVRGCYEHNETLGLCFDVKKGAMNIKKATGEDIVHYQELGHDIFVYRVLDEAFIAGHGPSIFHVPDNVPRESEALRKFVREARPDEVSQQETTKNYYQAAMSELHYVPEVQLLERLSAALGGNSTRLEILQPFHGLCLTLVKASEVEIPDELRAVPDMEDETADQHEREKRCSRPTKNSCRGMCGPSCVCWSWYCGDCCWHRGCYEHDLCCKVSRFSKYCLTPPKCSRFKGYPKCVGGWSWK